MFGNRGKTSNRGLSPIWSTVPVGCLWLGGGLDCVEVTGIYTCEIGRTTGSNIETAWRFEQRPEGFNRRAKARRFGQRIIKAAMMKWHRMREPDLMRRQRANVIDDILEQNRKLLIELQYALLAVVSERDD